MPAGERAFMIELISSLGLVYSIEAEEDFTVFEVSWNPDDDESDEESVDARERVIQKYENADRLKIKSQEEEHLEKQAAFDESFLEWKKDYYRVSKSQSFNLEIGKTRNCYTI